MAATQQQKSFCVLEFAQTNSVIAVQRSWRRRYGTPAPSRHTIKKWVVCFKEKGNVFDQRKGRSGRPAVSDDVVDSVRQSF